MSKINWTLEKERLTNLIKTGQKIWPEINRLSKDIGSKPINNALSIACPFCHVGVGSGCVTAGGKARSRPHDTRVAETRWQWHQTLEYKRLAKRLERLTREHELYLNFLRAFDSLL